MNIKKIVFIGLGKMGYYIALRIIDSGESILVYDSNQEKITKLEKIGAEGARSIENLTTKLTNPKVIIFCVPAGKVIDELISQLDSNLAEGDTIIDLGNSFYKDSQRRAKLLRERKIEFIDVGMSGGIEGAKNGACLMIGGNKKKISELDYLFKIISGNRSYEYFGKSGSGHLIKGYHNMIEYGYLQSLAEGLESLHEIAKKENMTINLEKLCNLWSRGSIIESRIILDARKAFQRSPTLNEIYGSVYGQTLEEIKNLIKLATSCGVKIYSCEAALKARIDSQKNPTFSGKIINAIRNIFGEHKDWKK